MNTEDMLEKILNKLNNIEDNQTSMKSQQEENTSILRALEHASTVHKAEIDKINFQSAEIKGEITNLRKESNEKLDAINNAIKEIRTDVSLANVTSSKNRIDIEMIKNVINK